MSSEELKPCPFCGGKADPKGWLNGDGERGPECEQCGATAGTAANWNRRAQLLAAIQGGMGEAEAEKQLQEWARGKFSFAGRYKGSVYGNTDWALARAIHTDLLAHYQRITAAMAAERNQFRELAKANGTALGDALRARDALRAELESYRQDPSYDIACKTIRELRAELAEVKGREAVIWCDPSNHSRTCTAKQKATATGATASALAPLTMALYASPPASPDVEGLLAEIRQRCSLPDWARSRIDTALSTWRQAQEVKP
ncbi:hypothetical protein MAJJADAN_00070 [Pseudomonas phage Amjad_SA]|nr:hypothetical protein MAJJADAN_00070 [Pseudomonas phage Amjad_SA]